MRLGAVAAGHWDVELGVAPHAVLGDVEAGGLDLRLSPDPERSLHRPERGERRAEGERSHREEAERLDSELVEAAGVDEPARARGEVLGEGGNGEDPGCERAPDAREAVDGDRPDGIVDPDPLDEEDADDRDRRRDQPDHDRGPRGDEARGGRDGDERGDDAVQHHRDVRLLEHDPSGEDAPERARRSGEIRRQGDVAEVADPVARDHAEGRARVEAEPAEPEDERAEDGERHVVARDRVCPAIGAELADPGPEEERARERGERALVVDDRRAGEVLHAKAVEPTAGVPDPVRDDGVDDGEDGAEGEVDPELRALCHGAPDDRERDAGENDFEEVAGARRNRAEEAERRRGDPQEGVGTRKEARRADDRVPVAEGKAEADRPVDERADPEDEDVLAGDVGGVLHPGEAGLEEGESRLHEHHEDRRDDDPDSVRSDQQVGCLHLASTSSRRAPVLLCVTSWMGEVQTRPSPAGLPLRAASAIASTTASARASSTTKTSSAFGRKRDSKTRPRYSCVMPRCRPCPTASRTVTPT